MSGVGERADDPAAAAALPAGLTQEQSERLRALLHIDRPVRFITALGDAADIILRGNVEAADASRDASVQERLILGSIVETLTRPGCAKSETVLDEATGLPVTAEALHMFKKQEEQFVRAG